MGTAWLRVAVWIVAIASIFGNLSVIFVLLPWRLRMNVSKMLMVSINQSVILISRFVQEIC